MCTSIFWTFSQKVFFSFMYLLASSLLLKCWIDIWNALFARKTHILQLIPCFFDLFAYGAFNTYFATWPKLPLHLLQLMKMCVLQKIIVVTPKLTCVDIHKNSLSCFTPKLKTLLCSLFRDRTKYVHLFQEVQYVFKHFPKCVKCVHFFVF